MQIEEIIQENENHIIKYNVDLLVWYFTKNKKVTDDIEKEKIFSLMSYALLEDHYCFMRILLYIANTRKSGEEEISYKIMIHFLSIMFPDVAMANIDLFIQFGKKDDILYFLQCSNITKTVLTYIKHKVKMDKDFQTLLDGKLINKKINSVIKYKPNFKSDTTWNDFLIQLLDDSKFNGITL